MIYQKQLLFKYLRKVIYSFTEIYVTKIKTDNQLAVTWLLKIVQQFSQNLKAPTVGNTPSHN